MKTVLLMTIFFTSFLIGVNGQQQADKDFLFKTVIKALQTEDFGLVTNLKMPFDKILKLAEKQNHTKLVRDLKEEQSYNNGEEIGLQQLDDELKMRISYEFGELKKNTSPNVLNGATYLRTELVADDWGIKPWESTQKVYTFFKNYRGYTYCMLTHEAKALSEVFTVKVESQFAEATTVKEAREIFEPVLPITNESNSTVVKSDENYHSNTLLMDSSSVTTTEVEEATSASSRIVKPVQVSKLSQLPGYFDAKKQQWISSNILYHTTKFLKGNELAVITRVNKEADFIGMGLIDKKGKIIAQAIYSQLYYYPSNKIYRVYLNNKQGILNDSGIQIVAPQYNFISENVEQDLLRVVKDDLVGFINLKGKVIIPVKYMDVQIAGQGLIAFALHPQKWGYINFEDKVIIEPMFTAPSQFVNGKCILQKEGGEEYTVYTDGRVIKLIE